jgi:DNA-binding CsgD family transcriptional regulator
LTTDLNGGYALIMYVSSQNSQILAKTLAVLCTPTNSFQLRQNLVNVVAQLLNADYVASFVWKDADASFIEGVSSSHNIAHLRQYESHFQFDDPIAPRLRSLRIPTLVSRVIPQKQLVNSEFFDRFLDVESMYWGMNIFAHNGFKDIGDLRIWRSKGKKDFSHNELAMMQMLYPGIVSALNRATEEDGLAVEVDTGPASRTFAQVKKMFNLSHREAEVTDLVARGLADKVIAKQLNISFTTVRTYLSGALKKTEQKDRKSLMAFYAQQRLKERSSL